MRRHLPQQDDQDEHPLAEGRAWLKRDALPLFLGFALALALGWGAFPQLLYSRQEQPVAFNHVLHLGQAGLTCGTCHYTRPDGSFVGRPPVAVCAECHSAPVGKTPAEERLISEYITPEKDIPWQSYARQPEHVFFSHAAHSFARCNTCHKFTETALCASCHGDMSKSETLPAYAQNRITGYSQEAMTMRACERCHALPAHAKTTASNNCAVCHK